MAKAKLRQILAADKGKVPYLEKQKKLQKEARKRKKELAEKNDDESDAEEEEQVNGKGTEKEDAWEDESDSEEEGRTIDTSKLDNSESDSDSEEDDDEEEEEEDDEEEDVLINGILKVSKPTAEADEDEDEDEDDEDIPLSEISEDDEDPDADIIPRQKLTINNHPALLAARASIALPIKKSTPFSTHHTLSTADPVAIADVHDDLTRELAFYTQALDAARRGRDLILAEGAAFTRPTDYFAEMVKSEEHMGRIKDRMKEEAAQKKASADAKRQRDLKKFGKAVQVARLQERHKEKRDMLDKIGILKRKRAGADLGDENEDDPFDVAVEKAANTKGKDGRQSRGPNAKRQRKDEKFGFGGRKKFAKSSDAMSTGDLSGFSAKGMKRNSFGGGKKPKTPRPGKSKRQGKR
ncbi:hypothetical protein DRE_01790 [Drechslerella stenobrocha 248]|uniref:rRNA-processing protein EBP2 n=1 Tax=Drechslerella stenobrocha 248 TaxID=1043628 RepID=W7I8E6_9PEZI|nr:hypothetical protein DRE_01790 [Drechslerella stenobrocha 248]